MYTKLIADLRKAATQLNEDRQYAFESDDPKRARALLVAYDSVNATIGALQNARDIIMRDDG